MWLRHFKKSEKLKSQNLSKSQKLAKSGKKSLKIRNSPNFDVTKAELSFLTSNAITVFNRLWLAFIIALILQYFDPKCPN